jgi:type VI secretion system protein ImpK
MNFDTFAIHGHSLEPFAGAAPSPTSQFGLDDDFFAAGPGRANGSLVDDFGLGDTALPSQAPRRRGDGSIDKAFDLAAINPLVSAASPLLWLAGRLNESAAPDDIAEFRSRVLDEIKHFETAAMARDIPNRLVRVSRYALCAAIDDIILNTRWGGASGWASNSLVGVLYNETWGGERFYDLLSQMLQQPEQNVDCLELMAICLAIGFFGKYRVMEGGQGQLTRLRHDLYRTIRHVRGPYERSLSGVWAAASAPHRPPRAIAVPGLAALAVLLVLAALWAFSSISLRGSIEQAAEQIRSLAPSIPVVVERAGVPQIPDPLPPVRQTQIERISEALATDIAASRIEVTALSDTVVVRMLAASFPSGGVDLAAHEEPLVRRIGGALDAERGPILVIGHTDNVPVGAGSPLGDNMKISIARARSAAEMLQRHVAAPSRVRFEGRGQNDPIASNATPSGRTRNRRVEFQIAAEPAP